MAKERSSGQPLPYDPPEDGVPKSLKKALEELLEKFKDRKKIKESEVFFQALQLVMATPQIKKKGYHALELTLIVLSKLKGKAEIDYDVRNLLKEGVDKKKPLRDLSKFFRDAIKELNKKRKEREKDLMKRYFNAITDALNEYLRTIGYEEGWEHYINKKVILQWNVFVNGYELFILPTSEEERKKREIEVKNRDIISEEVKKRKEEKREIEEVLREIKDFLEEKKEENEDEEELASERKEMENTIPNWQRDLEREREEIESQIREWQRELEREREEMEKLIHEWQRELEDKKRDWERELEVLKELLRRRKPPSLGL